METRKRLKLIIVFSVIGILVTIYRFYDLRSGDTKMIDWISIGATLVFITGLYFYFKKKWEREE
jgi:hypothetical protein